MNRHQLKVGSGVISQGLVYLLIIAAVALLLPAKAGAQDDRSFYFPAVIIEAEVNPDGSMQVVEERTFRFNGRYRGAWSYIPLKNNSMIRDVQVSERGMPYREVAVGVQDISGVYYVEYEPDQVYIDWSFEAYNEDRTFIISYTVDNAVLVHTDLAELYWQFIGKEWGERAEYVSITLRLPPGAGEGDIRAWGHGPLYGDVQIISPVMVVWEVDGLPANTFVEGRVTFPSSLVGQANNFSGKEGLPGILAEEQKWARQANLKRSLTRLDYFVGPLIAIAMLIYYIITRFRSKRAPGISAAHALP